MTERKQGLFTENIPGFVTFLILCHGLTSTCYRQFFNLVSWSDLIIIERMQYTNCNKQKEGTDRDGQFFCLLVDGLNK